MEETYGLKDYSDGSTTFSRDPVCGAPVDEATAPAKTGYAGQMYYFCSVDCQKEFDQHPGAYIGARS
jgi:YHS domain-containing protein